MLAFVAVLWLVPTFGLLLSSLLPSDVIGSQGWRRIFSEPSVSTLDNYKDLFDNDEITTALVTTLIVAIGGTALPIIVGARAGYAFAWMEFPGRDWLFLGVVALLVVPLQMALIPMFSFYNSIGIYDTVLALILFHTAFGLPFAIFLLRNFFIGIPKDILESARVDGASELRIFTRLILPLGLPRSPRSPFSSSSGPGTTSSLPSPSWAPTRSPSPWRSPRSSASLARTSTSSRPRRSSLSSSRSRSSSPSSATSSRVSWPAQ